MTEPTTSITSACAAGVVACTTALVGLHPHALLFAFIGATIGLSFAPVTSKWRAASLFVAVVLGAALLGSWAAAEWSAGSKLAQSGYALVIATLFHPLLTAVVEKLPAVLDGFINRATGSK
jgi:hypothetical protein